MTGRYWPHLVLGCIVLTTAAFVVIGMTVIGLKNTEAKIIREQTVQRNAITNVTRVVSRSLCPVREGERNRQLAAARRCNDVLYAAQTKAQRERMRGPRGFRGRRGPRGQTGPTGARGPRGFTGTRGLQGPRGFTGLTGRPGLGGVPGPQGPPGLTGTPGQSAPPASAPPIVPPGQGGTPPGLTQQPSKGNGPPNGKRKGGKP